MSERRLIASLAALALAACEAEPPSVTASGPIVDRGWALIFFDVDSTTISENWRNSLRQTATVALESKFGGVNVTGHADRSGSDTYNMDLSRRRAEAVRDELVRLGVPVERIKLQWRGESQNMVTTKDGVREPQNRRAEAMVW
jgi:outer membrane protein OmpA-like peptidoglycan-associated protein